MSGSSTCYYADPEEDLFRVSLEIDAGYRIDLLVERCVVLEIKAVERLLPIHEAQLISYLKLGDYSLGLLVNFNVRLLKQGIRRFAN